MIQSVKWHFFYRWKFRGAVKKLTLRRSFELLTEWIRLGLIDRNSKQHADASNIALLNACDNLSFRAARIDDMIESAKPKIASLLFFIAGVIWMGEGEIGMPIWCAVMSVLCWGFNGEKTK